MNWLLDVFTLNAFDQVSDLVRVRAVQATCNLGKCAQTSAKYWLIKEDVLASLQLVRQPVFLDSDHED